MNSSLATRLAVVTGLLLAPILAGCGAVGGTDASGSGTRMVASFYPLAYVAGRVAGDHAEVANLTRPGQEPHDLELTVQQTAEVSDADVVVYEKGLMPAVDEAVAQSDAPFVVDAAKAVDLVDDDPHFWLDPRRMARLADAVAEAMTSADPDHRSDYAKAAAALKSDLRELDAEFRAGLAKCRIDTVVVSHDAFGYLAKRYGLDMVGISGLSPDAEPSPAHIRELRDLIARTGVTTVFSEELGSPKYAKTLADEAGVRTAVLDPIEGLGDDTADEDYFSLMRGNLAALRKASACR